MLKGCDSYPFLSVVESINQASTSEAVLDVLAKTLAEIGADHFGIHFLPRPEDRLEDVCIAWQVPPAWREHYLAENYFQSDPAFRHARRTVFPFDYTSAPYDPEREPGTKEVMERAHDFNVDRQVTVPIPGPCGVIGIVGIAGPHFDDREVFKPFLQALGLHAFHRLEQLIGRKHRRKAGLTDREREVLAWASEGKTAWEIGCILHLSQRTVEWHMRQACEKLGATNRLQAIAILGSARGTLDPIITAPPASRRS